MMSRFKHTYTNTHTHTSVAGSKASAKTVMHRIAATAVHVHAWLCIN